MRRFTTGQRLKELMKSQGIRQVDILDKTRPYQKSLGINMSKSHLSNYVNDRSSPDNNKLRLLSSALGVNEPWLMGYEVDNTDKVATEPDSNETRLIEAYRKLSQSRKENVDTFIGDQLSEQNNNIQSTNKKEKPARENAELASSDVLIFEKRNGTTIYPNVIGAAAGVGTCHYADLDFDEIMIPTSEAYEQTNIIPMYVRGDSMEPKYFDGDIIWVDTHEKSINAYQIGVFDTTHGRVVKLKGVDKLISINPRYTSIELDEYMEFSTYGKVVDVIRRDQLETWQSASWV